MDEIVCRTDGGRWAEFLTEAVVFAGHMVVTRTVEFRSARRGTSRAVVFERRFDWPARDLTDDALRRDAESALAGMGWRPCNGSWWYLDAAGWAPGCERSDHWYALLERIPGSTAGWRD